MGGKGRLSRTLLGVDSRMLRLTQSSEAWVKSIKPTLQLFVSGMQTEGGLVQQPADNAGMCRKSSKFIEYIIREEQRGVGELEHPYGTIPHQRTSGQSMRGGD